MTDSSCFWSQVSNPSMQFMLYETMLNKLKKRRALNKKNNNGITALEVRFHLDLKLFSITTLL